MFCEGNKDSSLTHSIPKRGITTHHTLAVTVRQVVSVQVAHLQVVPVEVLHRNEIKETATLTAVTMHEHCPTQMNYTQGVHTDTKLVLFRTCVVQIQFEGQIGGKSEVAMSHLHKHFSLPHMRENSQYPRPPAYTTTDSLRSRTLKME